MNLEENISRVKNLMGLLTEQDSWTLKAASGPQKCGISKGQGGGEDCRDSRAWDRDVAREDKELQKIHKTAAKNFLSLSYDKSSFPLDREAKKLYYQQYQQFMQNNPGVITDGEGFDTQEKYAVISKTLDFLRTAPQISYTINLGKKFGLNKNSTFKDVVDAIKQMGGYAGYVSWFNGGGQAIK